MSGTPHPEYNQTGQDFQARSHFRYRGSPIVDIHAHVTLTAPEGPAEPSSAMTKPVATTDAAAFMLDVAKEFHIGRTYSMCPPADIGPLREHFGQAIGFNGPISKKPDEPDEVAYQTLEQFLQGRVDILKLWSAPRGRERGLFVDAPWRIEALKRARAAGIRIVMAHIADPDVWWDKTYADTAKFGTKANQYVPFKKMLSMFSDMTWIGAHMGGDPEHPDHLAELLDEFPHLHFDTSATKWQVREVSRNRDAIRNLICRYPNRFLFGSDLVTRHQLPREHYISRYWCQRTLWESDWEGPSPIADPDFVPAASEGTLPMLRGLALPQDVLEQVYSTNARRILQLA